MTNSILSDFFNGNIVPNEKQFNRDSEFGKTAAELVKEEEKLRAKEQKKQVKEDD